MRFTIAAVLAFASSAIAVGVDATDGFDRINTPNKDEQLPAGKPYVVKWENPAPYTEGPVYIQLLGGKDPNTLSVKTEKIATVDNKDQQYTWNVDASLGDDATYGLRFVWEKDDNIVQYSKPFQIKKADGAGSSSGTVTVTSSQGVKTVTLSSATTTTTDTPSSSASSTTTVVVTSTTTSKPFSSSTASANTTVARNTTTSVTLSKTTGLATQTASQTTAATTKPSSAAAHAAGSIAAVGGIIAALLAL
ncbi:Cell wall beta-glucan synthesis [Cordyceps fumosorosea ARSEF 2679]|uniref:Cell wall beta-glucan synthesis n=1 Tax=Cordyceps fumosorosea (strain ARSEF 2679) TaxID=1081104 RepID=A0A167ZI05_CORFA|nr:Cell wall beta-glucan synthesis [Cordyceps fumosorosea ARSEF 2679]OAA67543.1 Cell wall beta-glucan synthesis [Cordyceps fumosorosea ARSEF 2679]